MGHSLKDIHATALQQFQESYDANSHDREQAQIARRFVNIRGAQWDWANGQFNNRMMLEIDHVSGEVARIANEYRRNRISAEFLPADGTDADAMADACASRYRADTQDGQGREARDTAFYGALEGGMGGLRLRAEYEGCEGYQRICLEPINDAESSLFFDANSRRKDASDAGHAFLITPWTRRAFVAKYGEECASWPAELMGQFQFNWFGTGADLVYVAEYFVKEVGSETFRVFEGFGGEVQELSADDLDEDAVARLLAMGFVEKDPRTEKYDRIAKYVMNGAKILSKREVIPGRAIPLVPQYGYWRIIQGVQRFRGHVSKQIDPQIVYNLQVSSVGETAAASGIEKPIFLAEQIAGHANAWQNDNVDQNAFLVINPIRDAQGNIASVQGPVGFTKSPDVAPAVAALIQLTKQDLADQNGNQQNTEMANPNTSGIAMELAQGKSDMRSSAFIDGAAEAEMRLAEIWQGMAAEIYVEKGRKLKTISDSDKRGTVEIGKKVFNAKTGEMADEIDFSRAKFDVIMDVGPTSASKRQSIARTLFSVLPFATDPADQKKLLAYGLMNIEGEGMSDIRDDARRTLLALGVVKPTKEEQAEMEANQAPPQPDPNAIMAEALAQESNAKAAKAVADTALSQARTEEVRANTAETLAGIPIAQRKQAVAEAQAIAGELNAGQ